MSCTASTNGGALMRSGKTPQERKVLYYSACVVTRLVLVALLLLAAWHIPTTTCWFGVVVGSVAFAFGVYYTVNQGCRWWRPFSLAVVAAAIVAVGAACLASKDKVATPFLIGALVLAHLVSGVMHSFQATPWDET